MTCRTCDREFCYHCGDSGTAMCQRCLDKQRASHQHSTAREERHAPFCKPLTPAATAIFVMCLDLASDEVIDVDRPEAWQEAYPLSATCFTPELARATLVDLVEKLRLPGEYVPTRYHWSLCYERR